MKIIFENSTPKIPKLGILGANFKVFYFWTKFSNLTNSIALNSNMIVDFKISTPKIDRVIFGTKFCFFLLFFIMIWSVIDLNVLISNMIIPITFLFQNTQIKYVWSKFYAIFYFFTKLWKTELCCDAPNLQDLPQFEIYFSLINDCLNCNERKPPKL